MDWNRYREQFPLRYLMEGEFDKRLLGIIKNIQRPITSALDVGGGVLGTQALKRFATERAIPVDLLDPFVAVKPSWMRNAVSWDSQNRYDLVVSRGAINYLTIQQLYQLRDMLSPSAILIANTFLTPPSTEWSERLAVNSRGEQGLERSRLVGRVVEHQLVFPDYTINHTFFYHPLETYQEVFGRMNIEQYGKNSYLLTIGEM